MRISFLSDGYSLCATMLQSKTLQGTIKRFQIMRIIGIVYCDINKYLRRTKKHVYKVPDSEKQRKVQSQENIWET